MEKKFTKQEQIHLYMMLIEFTDEEVAAISMDKEMTYCMFHKCIRCDAHYTFFRLLDLFPQYTECMIKTIQEEVSKNNVQLSKEQWKELDEKIYARIRKIDLMKSCKEI